MKGYDFKAGKSFETHIPSLNDDSQLMIVCDSSEVFSLMDIFDWDADTVNECTNLDETVRYTSYDGYDFISLMYAENETGAISTCEVNLFFSKNYLALVLPETPGVMLSDLADKLALAIPFAETRPVPLVHLYYLVFDSLTSDYSDMLEGLEDEMETLSEVIELKPSKEQSMEIGRLRKTAYTYKKLLRAFSYIGGQVLMDENNLLDSNQLRYFRNIGTRLVKLYDFADNLYVLSNELLHLFESKSSSQINETINKLTIITLFFGPLTVIAGIYGMNFVNMPELKWSFGYPAALGLMAVVSLIIYSVLKKKKWI